MPGLSRRQLLERRRRRRSTLIAGVSTAVVAAVLAVVVLSAPGWDDVQRAFFSPEDFADALPTCCPPSG